jgi:hypothetical protein
MCLATANVRSTDTLALSSVMAEAGSCAKVVSVFEDSRATLHCQKMAMS